MKSYKLKQKGEGEGEGDGDGEDLHVDMLKHLNWSRSTCHHSQLIVCSMTSKRAFIAGVTNDNGYGWAIAKSLAAAGAKILALNIFESSLRRGKFDESRVLPDGSLMEITKVYPLDAVFDNPEDVPEDIKANKRYAGSTKWTVQEVAESVKEDFGSIDILVHSLANGPEVTKPLLETSRKGYLAALSASSGSSISLTYIASKRIIPGSAKAALESDTRVSFNFSAPENSPFHQALMCFIFSDMCSSKCAQRCAKAGMKDRCMRFYGICCSKCKCVPSGTYGNKHECPCYRDLKNSKGRPKCP
ncbi:hypothetical protein VNO77_38973 [Canavalia gladiata]|uniref:Uncharacterized protein n=1 Tax=Canavalia gladiata TaxID=3824 RepID=A0AAN9PVE6_CANGL